MTSSYTLDTNVIVTLNRDQPRDIYVSVWQALESLIAAGRAFMNREAYEELVQVDDECAPWAKAQAGFVQHDERRALGGFADHIGPPRLGSRVEERGRPVRYRARC